MATRRRRAAGRSGQPELVPSGIRIGDEVVPLYAASVHYWRLEPAVWRPALDAVKRLGFRLVDTYVPWGVHETAAGTLDFGRVEPRLDVARFVTVAEKLGLYCIIRPGPHINAELTWFGLPERVVWEPECQARSPRDNPVILPVPPLAFPVPSYASDTFLAEVGEWFEALGNELASRCYPDGPIVMVQVDNEGAMYFRDGVYDQDYHPDSIRGFRRFLQKKYSRVDALRKAHANAELTFAKLEPPRALNAASAEELAPHLDWAEWQEQLLADSFSRMREDLNAAGFGRIPTSHNLPLSEGATPLDPERIGKVVELIGLDYYHGASPPQRAEIARRTSELSTRAAQRNHPPFAGELGAGFPPFFPPLTELDNTFTTLCALAYGLRGFNVYMAVERDRWVGAPIDSQARKRPAAAFWKRLLAALERTRFAELERRVQVCIVVPRSIRRLARVCHAFGPLSAALFQVLGGGAQESCLEDDFGLGSSLPIDTEQFVRRVEHALENARVPYAIVGGDLLGWALDHARWTVLASSGALELELLAQVRAALEAGKALTLGPHPPSRDATLAPLREPVALASRPQAAVPALIGLDQTSIEAAVQAAIRALGLSSLFVAPDSAFATLHHDSSGRPTLLFVLNPSDDDIDAEVDSAGAMTAVNALDGDELVANHGRFALRLPRRTAVMLELRPNS
jgi:beta-galactosidase